MHNFEMMATIDSDIFNESTLTVLSKNDAPCSPSTMSSEKENELKANSIKYIVWHLVDTCPIGDM